MKTHQQGKALVLVLLAVVLLALVGVVLAVWTAAAPQRVTSDSVLTLDLTRGYAEHRPDETLSFAFLPHDPTLRQVVAALERAAGDDRVLALVARVGSAPMGLAQTQELRDAVAAFRASGKKAIAFADTFGEWSVGNAGYYLASGFDEIHLQPSGDVGLIGLHYEVPFYRGALDKIGFEPRMDHRHEYKNAMNSYTETSFTPAHREAMQALADSQFDQLISGIAAGRGIAEPEVRGLFDEGPFLGSQALAAGLVDRLAYRDEVWARVHEEFGDDVERVDIGKYSREAGKLGSGTRVALIYGVGPVVRGKSTFNPWTGSAQMGSDTVSAAFQDAVDDGVEAILFRVDSPGGSYVASDTIWRETVRARDADVPVVVSMGNLAGSGGYFVAMAAHSIVAQPGTITGSIGVYGGKLVTEEGWAKLGVTFDSVETADRAGMYSGITDFDTAEWEKFGAGLDRVYQDFTAKVAAGRGLAEERVGEIARGRIWTGAAALELGLVDRLGGYPVALAEVREALGLDSDDRLRLELYPRPRSPLELFVEQGRWVASAPHLARAAAELAREARPLLAAARRMGLGGPAPGVLEMVWPEPGSAP